MYISKKELLEMTGISYGQLYRWKREKLIPEEWFIKQSSYTGQETIFPKEKILERIRFIMDMKDRYSLEEIAGLLKLNSEKRKLSYEEVCAMEELDEEVVGLMKKEDYSFMEAAFLQMLTRLYRNGEGKVSLENLAGLLEGIQERILAVQSETQMLTVVQAERVLYGILHREDAPLSLDGRFAVEGKFSIEEIVSGLKQKHMER